jgi:small conductance mechanosensitive channel
MSIYANDLMNMGIKYLPQLFSAILLFIIGMWVINWFTRVLTNMMMKKGFDTSLKSFFSSLISVTLKIMLLITIAGILGIQTTSFVAILGAAGLAIGLALQGSLGNFAGGVLILVFKPFKIGDLIENGGQFGEVKEIQMFNTVLLTPDNKTVILSNSALSNGTIINYSRHGNLRVDITVAVAADSNIEKVRQTINEVFADDANVLKTPAPTVNVLSLANGMVTMAVRPYSTPENYWAVFFGLQENIKLAFEKNGIKAPIPTQITIEKHM